MDIDAKTLQAFHQLVTDKGFGDGLLKFLKQVPWLPTTYNTNLQLVNANYTAIRDRQEVVTSPWAVDDKHGTTIGLFVDRSMTLSFAAARLHDFQHSKLHVTIDFIVSRTETTPKDEVASVAFALTYRKADSTFLQVVCEPADVKYGQTTRYTFQLEPKSVGADMLFEAVVGVTPMNDCTVFVRGVWLGQDV